VDTVKAVAHARSGNDANVISMAADWVEESIVGEVMRAFLTTEFSGEERHNRRIEMIENLEKKE